MQLVGGLILPGLGKLIGHLLCKLPVCDWLVKQHTATLAANIEFAQMSLLIGLLRHVTV